MAETPAQPGSQPPAQPIFNPNAGHHVRPALRPIRLFPAAVGGQQLLGIADARQISERAVITHPAAQFVLQHMDGQRTTTEIVGAVGRGLTLPILEQLVAQLDDAGLLYGPTYDALVAKMRAEFDASPILPPGSTAAMADALAAQQLGGQEQFQAASEEERARVGAERLRAVFDEWMSMALKDVADPGLTKLPKAVVAPHLDYQRGWINYGSTWGRLRVADRPDRVVVLGTNHFGEGTGVSVCPKGYESPFGVCDVDQGLLASLEKALGTASATKVLANRYDHEKEHSIELQVPWIQHVFGKDAGGNYPKVLGILVHDPSVNNGESYDGQGVGLQEFVDAMKRAIAAQPGRTLVVSSADLSHAGPAFGDQQVLAGEGPEIEEARNNVFRHDRAMLELLTQGKPQELVASMSWQSNPTRWCSIGNLVAAQMIVEPAKVELCNYAGAMDQQGTTLVTSASMLMV